MSKQQRVVRPIEVLRHEPIVHSDRKPARRVVGRLGVLIPVVLAWITACRDNTGLRPSGVDSLPNIAGLIVSAPVPGPAALSVSRALVAGAAVSAKVVYVSLAPGSVPTGLQATIQNAATRQSIRAEVVEGGFDPVAIQASIGDTLVVEVTGLTADKSRAVRVVALPRPPYVVRTDPPPQKKDVALNAIIVIVFSEPLDAATLGPGSVTLLRGTTPVAGAVRFSDADHLKAEFHPNEQLAAKTDYQVVLSQGIRSENGLSLDAAVSVAFTTGSSIGYTIGGTVSGLEGAGLVLRLSPGEYLSVAANGPIAFTSTLDSGDTYAVTVQTLPSKPAQLCVVAGGEGIVGSANVTDIAITCSDADPSLTGKIVFSTSRDAAPDILVLDLDGSTITQLTNGPDWDYTPQWSPDRSQIAFVRKTRDAAFGSWISHLWVMRADGSDAHEIGVGSAPGYGRWFSWSPDGTKFAVFDGTGFSTINADGSGGGVLPWKNPLAGTTVFSPAWSPDGSTIAFFGDAPNSGLSVFQVLVMNADGSNVRRLTSANTYGGIDPEERGPAWSPDGTNVTFWSAAYGLTVANRNGTATYSASHDDWRNANGSAAFSVQGDAVPDWSPDGRHLVFQMHGQLFVTMADGSGTPRQLTSVPGGAFDPAWLK